MKQTNVKGHRKKVNGKLIYVAPYKRKVNRGARKKSNEEIIRDLKLKQQEETFIDFFGIPEQERQNRGASWNRKKKILDKMDNEDEYDYFETPIKKGFLEDVTNKFQDMPSYKRTLPDGKVIDIKSYTRVKPIVESQEVGEILREFRRDNPEGGLIKDRDKAIKQGLKQRRLEQEKLKKRFEI